ncbi:hypothetical protein GOBAR_AA18084 [Gossypium barbadense]|uniref:Uncharacterized protein n=1 Tax=Gossypium barbadense TaxID=3634 RepID=A0A2P5XGV3_GOSBA|nr:hypothetical protein GOBAR_AA18084 [Gossypium barbadense]
MSLSQQIRSNVGRGEMVRCNGRIDLESYEENRVLGEGLRSARAHYVSTDLRREAQILGGLRLFRKSLIVALKGVEVVFHMAFHHSVNLQGMSQDD